MWLTSFRRCGSTLPDDIVTTATELTLRFTTDGSIEVSGFQAVYNVTERKFLAAGAIKFSLGDKN